MQLLALWRQVLRKLKHLGLLVPIGVWIGLLRLTGVGDDKNGHSNLP